MEAFVQQHAASVTGTLSGWDRLRFRGTLRMLANAAGMFRFLCYTGHLLKDFGSYALGLSRQVRTASLAAAESAGRPVEHLASPSVSKEGRAREIARRDGVGEGLIGVLTAVEPCWSYDVRSNRASGHLELIHAYRKCQHLYHYLIHPAFGFMHVRLQTWLPFNLHVCVNGREWLARQMDAAGVAYRREGNCFTWVSDPHAAQPLLDGQVKFDWAKALGGLVPSSNPALRQAVAGYGVDYYWSLEESEYATDVTFRSRADLAALYPGLVRHGIETFGSREVMRFLGRSVAAGITPRFAGEVVSDVRKLKPATATATAKATPPPQQPGRYDGIRIKHRLNRNSIKMYDKAGSVLRVETTLNDMRDLQAPRVVNGRRVYKRMRKGVADMPRRAQVSAASNRRYLEALAAVKTPLPLKTLTDKLSRPVTWKGKRVRGLNVLGPDDAALLEAAGRGEFLISGLRNRDLQALLFAKPADDPAEQRRRCGQVTRKLRMLRAHGLVHKVSHSHRYMVSDKGRRVIAALHAAREADVEKLTAAA
jgi:hypothetical protein